MWAVLKLHGISLKAAILNYNRLRFNNTVAAVDEGDVYGKMLSPSFTDLNEIMGGCPVNYNIHVITVDQKHDTPRSIIFLILDYTGTSSPTGETIE